MRAFFDEGGGKTWDHPQGRWFDRETDIRKWQGVTCDAARRVIGLKFSCLTKLSERIGDFAALAELDLTNCHDLTALPEWLGD